MEIAPFSQAFYLTKQPYSGDSSLLSSTILFKIYAPSVNTLFFMRWMMAVNYHAWHIDKPICSPCEDRTLSYSKRHGRGVDEVINRQRRETLGKWEKRTTKKIQKKFEEDYSLTYPWRQKGSHLILWLSECQFSLCRLPVLSRLKYLTSNWMDWNWNSVQSFMVPRGWVLLTLQPCLRNYLCKLHWYVINKITCHRDDITAPDSTYNMKTGNCNPF